MKKMSILLALVSALVCLAALVPAGANTEVVVATDATGDAAVDPTLEAVGLDVVALAIRPTGSSLEFIVRVTNLPVTPPNEVVRYLWQMTVGGKAYWIQAKTSDISTATATVDDAPGTLARLQGAFRLRGNCGVVGVVSSCQHLLWLDGAFDTTKNEVRMTVPLGNPVAPDFRSGATIEQGLQQTMTASIQAAISNAATSDTVDLFDPYVIP